MPLILNGSTGISGIDGSAGTPSYQGNDSNTGIFYPAADTIAFAEGGVESMRIDSAGDVGIGSTNPTRKLQISQSIATTYTGDFDDAPNQLFIVNTNTTTNAYTGLQMDVGGNSQAAISAVRVGDGEVAMTFSSRVAGVRAERMRIDSSGNLLVGRTSSLVSNVRAEFAITDTSTSISSGIGAAISIQNLSTTNNTYSTIYFTNGGGGVDSAIYGLHEVGNGTSTGRTGSLVFATANLGGGVSERMRIDSAGNVGIGTSTITSGVGWTPKLVLSAAAPAVIIKGQNSQEVSVGSFDGMYIDCLGNTTGTSNNIIFRNNSGNSTFSASERMRITSSGNVLVGGTSPVETFSGIPTIQGVTNCIFVNKRDGTGAQSQFRFHNANGQVGEIYTNGSATVYATSSDYRLKENIAPMIGALDKVQQLKPCTYTWKIDGSNGEGFIAHELQEIAPDCVSGAKDGEQMQCVDYGKITPLLTAALQEALAKIESLEARLAVLESK